MQDKNHLNTFQPPEITETIADRFVDPRTFCRLRFSPTLATGVILGLLREHYGDPTSIIEPSLQQYVWRSDNTTAMMIETCTNDALTRIQMRPAILVRRNAIKIQKEGLDNEMKSLGRERFGPKQCCRQYEERNAAILQNNDRNIRTSQGCQERYHMF